MTILFKSQKSSTFTSEKISYYFTDMRAEFLGLGSAPERIDPEAPDTQGEAARKDSKRRTEFSEENTMITVKTIVGNNEELRGSPPVPTNVS